MVPIWVGSSVVTEAMTAAAGSTGTFGTRQAFCDFLADGGYRIADPANEFTELRIRDAELFLKYAPARDPTGRPCCERLEVLSGA